MEGRKVTGLTLSLHRLALRLGRSAFGERSMAALGPQAVPILLRALEMHAGPFSKPCNKLGQSCRLRCRSFYLTT